MVEPDDVEAREAWDEDDSEDLMELEMDEDELFFDDIGSDDDTGEFTDASDRYKSFSARRRIEIAREDKWLKSVMADFDDLDRLDDFDGQFAGGPSY